MVAFVILKCKDWQSDFKFAYWYVALRLLVVILLLANVGLFVAWQLSPTAEKRADRNEPLLPTIALYGEPKTTSSAMVGAASVDAVNGRVETSVATESVAQPASAEVQGDEADRVAIGDTVPIEDGAGDSFLLSAPMALDPSAELEQSAEAMTDESASGAGESSDGNESVAAVYSCYAIGPVLDVSKVQSMQSGLVRAGRRVFVRTITTEQVANYIVLMPAEADAAAARQLVAQLKAKGIGDNYIIPSGKNKNAVSLGVFSTISAASKRWQEVKALGFVPLLQPQKQTAEAKWFDIELPPDDQPEWVAAKQYQSIAVQSKRCRDNS